MKSFITAVLAAGVAVCAAQTAAAQTAAVQAAAAHTSAVQGAASQQEWRQVAPENLWVIDTGKGRVLVELSPEAAPNHVERIRTLTRQGFYDGLAFHRVIRGFMAQTGDPLGTGMGGSDLPSVGAEFFFRRGMQPTFTETPPGRPRTEPGIDGLFGSLPVRTQPDAQMFVTADNKVNAMPLFCPGVAGMARSGDPDSANSQFFLMTGYNGNLNGQYTAFGRVVSGLDVIESLRPGAEENNGAVVNPDRMTTVRIAADLAPDERPSVRVLDTGSPRFATLLAEQRAASGERFTACDVVLPVEVD